MKRQLKDELRRKGLCCLSNNQIILKYYRFLQEIGYEDIFNSEEMNEIKALYEKAQEEMKDNINQQQERQAQILEERLMLDAQEKPSRSGIMEEERKVAAAPANEVEQFNQIKKEVPAKYTLRSHMDIVRGVQFVPQIDAMASISEDCTVKLWSFKNIDSIYSENDGNLEPYITLRGHTGPLFSITGGHPKNNRLIFTAGSEGVIRVWNLPALNEVNQYGDTYDGRNYCIGQWVEASGETFWDLRHHNYQ